MSQSPPPYEPISLRRPEVAEAGRLSELMRTLYLGAYHRATDADNLARFTTATYQPEIQAAELIDPQIRTLVVERGSDWLGYAQLRLATRPPQPLPGERPIELGRIYLCPDAHGTGVAAALLQRLIELARAEAADGLWLKVWVHAPWAIGFYLKHGFTVHGRTHFQVGNFQADNHLMYRPLPAD